MQWLLGRALIVTGSVLLAASNGDVWAQTYPSKG